MRLIIFIILLFGINTAVANIIVNGTRIIYAANNKENIVQLVNNGTDPALVQSWIDNGNRRA